MKNDNAKLLSRSNSTHENDLKNLSIGALLETGHLMRDEIEERVKIIHEKIAGGEVLSDRENVKLTKIIEKLQTAKINEEKFGTNLFSLSAHIINIKYLSQQSLDKTANFFSQSLPLSQENKGKIPVQAQIYRPERRSNFKIILDENSIFGFYGDQYYVESNSSLGIFNFNLKFNDKKCIIRFENVKIRSSLIYPEEVQIKLLEALVKKYPQLEEKLANIEELNLEHSNVTNLNTLHLMIMHLRAPKQNYQPLSNAPCIQFPQNPNTNNIMNFAREFTKLFSKDQDFKFEKSKIKIAIGKTILDIGFKFSKQPSKSQPSTSISLEEAPIHVKKPHQISKL